MGAVISPTAKSIIAKLGEDTVFVNISDKSILVDQNDGTWLSCRKPYPALNTRRIGDEALYRDCDKLIDEDWVHTEGMYLLPAGWGS